MGGEGGNVLSRLLLHFAPQQLRLLFTDERRTEISIDFQEIISARVKRVTMRTGSMDEQSSKLIVYMQTEEKVTEKQTPFGYIMVPSGVLLASTYVLQDQGSASPHGALPILWRLCYGTQFVCCL